ncbi:MAG: YdcH family protein [Sandaracinaceae bacterium]|nr:MAG: DUF465 domain-containing protein [Sandaracinaceae bacterium]HBQ12162.1 hypothetical protein [Myxococcales bacterium]
MSRSQRRIDSNKNITRLEKRHKQLKAQVAEYESRLGLNPDEQVRLQKLKKEKLATKDELSRISSVP